MAGVTATVIVLDAINFPYIGAAPTQQQWATAIPRSEKNFSLVSGAVTVAAAGNEQSLNISAVLPEGFSYVLVEATVALLGADVADWQTSAFATLDDSAAAPTFRDVFSMEGGAIWRTNVTSLGRTFRCSECPTKIIIPKSDGGRCQFFLFNNVQDGAAMTVICFFRFLVFDLNQAYYYGVNTPTLTR